MTPERWQRVKELFTAAIERDAAERDSFLDRACGGDENLRKEVDALLSSDEHTLNLIDQPVMRSAAELLAESHSRFVPGQKFGSYKIEREAGRGGMGEVYLARDTRLDRPVAIKLLTDSFIHDSDRVRRFQQEARAASLLNHPNIVTIHEVAESDGLQFIVSEFVEGKTLREVIDAGGVKLERALDISIQTAGALSAAHNAGIVHRDIKPENIMVRPDGYVKVLDFGLAKLTERLRQKAPPGQHTSSSDTSEQSTKTGVVMGTVKYMSPEQARGEKVDHRTDIFSLGVVLYEAITGSSPFNGETASHTIVAILEQEPQPISEYLPNAPADLQRVIDGALRKDREERYQTVGGMLEDLQKVREDAAFQARRERDSGITADESKRVTVVAVQSLIGQLRSRTLVWAAIVAIAASALTLGVYEMTRATRVPSAQPVKVSRLTANGKISLVALSRDGKYTAYVIGLQRQQSLWVMQGNTGGVASVIPAADGVQFFGLAFSNDGDYIYVIRNLNNGPFELYRVPTLGGTPKRLVVNIDSAVTFSPDGTHLAFVRNISEDETRLVIANADGSGERTLATHKLPNFFLARGVVKISWSPDGESIACPAGNTELDPSHPMEVVEVRVQDGTERTITAQKWAEVQQVAWLGDGRSLVMTARDQLSSPPQLWRLSYPRGDTRKLTNDFNWYMDLSIGADSGPIATVQADGISNIWVAPEGDADHARQITESRLDGVQGLAWTPDGRVVYCSYFSGNADIWIMDADGGHRRQLTDDAGWDALPSVSPDGRYLVFVSDRASTQNLWRIDIDGGNPLQLTDGNGEVQPHCSPDGRWVYYCSDKFGQGSGHLWKVPLDGGDPVLVVDRLTSQPCVSPDQKLLAFNYWNLEVNPPFGVEVVPIEGGRALQRIDVIPGRFFCWAPDGTAIAYLDTRAMNVWSQPLDGRKSVQLSNFKTDQTFLFAWSRDGKQLALARGNVTSDIVLISDFK